MDRPLTLDLSGLTFMDSTGLAALLERRRRQAPGEGELRIRGAHGQILALLRRTGTLPLLTATRAARSLPPAVLPPASADAQGGGRRPSPPGS